VSIASPLQRASFVRSAALATALLLLAAACGDDDDTVGSGPAVSDTSTTLPPDVTGTGSPPSVTETGSSASSPTVPGTGVEQETADRGPDPARMDQYLRDLGMQLDPAEGDCADLPYIPGELHVYIAPEIRELPTERLWDEFLRPALESSKLVPTSERNPLPSGDNDDGTLVTTRGGPVFRITLQAGDLSVAAVAATNLTLRERLEKADLAPNALAVDVNHVGPFLPVGKFHPGSDPKSTSDVPTDVQDSAGGAHSVLVVDSPQLSDYDVFDESWDVNTATYASSDKKVDFVAGHGAFVVDLIQRFAPGSADSVKLSPVVHEPATPSWPGFLFDEGDLIRSLEQGLGADDPPMATNSDGKPALPSRRYRRHFDLINMSLGLFGCKDSPHPVLEGVLRDVVTPSVYAEKAEPPYVVAAAGNDGPDLPTRPHYPAAFARPHSTDAVASHVIAVGAAVKDIEPETYSNTCEVNAWAPGRAIAAFPWLGGAGFAEWEGTSFAAARVTAALADAPATIDATWLGGNSPDPIGTQADTAREPNPTC
jgi:hypothetical protein